MTYNDVSLLMSGMEIYLAPDDKACFKDIIHAIPQWRLTINVTVKYLRNIMHQS